MNRLTLWLVAGAVFAGLVGLTYHLTKENGSYAARLDTATKAVSEATTQSQENAKADARTASENRVAAQDIRQAVAPLRARNPVKEESNAEDRIPADRPNTDDQLDLGMLNAAAGRINSAIAAARGVPAGVR